MSVKASFSSVHLCGQRRRCVPLHKGREAWENSLEPCVHTCSHASLDKGSSEAESDSGVSASLAPRATIWPALGREVAFLGCYA